MLYFEQNRQGDQPCPTDIKNHCQSLWSEWAGRREHLKAIRFWEQKQRLRLIAGVKLRPEAGAEILKRHGFRRSIPVYAAIEQMLAETKPDICAITTPSGSHFDLAEKALQAGCIC